MAEIKQTVDMQQAQASDLLTERQQDLSDISSRRSAATAAMNLAGEYMGKSMGTAGKHAPSLSAAMDQIIEKAYAAHEKFGANERRAPVQYGRAAREAMDLGLPGLRGSDTAGMASPALPATPAVGAPGGSVAPLAAPGGTMAPVPVPGTGLTGESTASAGQVNDAVTSVIGTGSTGAFGGLGVGPGAPPPSGAGFQQAPLQPVSPGMNEEDRVPPGSAAVPSGLAPPGGPPPMSTLPDTGERPAVELMPGRGDPTQPPDASAVRSGMELMPERGTPTQPPSPEALRQSEVPMGDSKSAADAILRSGHTSSEAAPDEPPGVGVQVPKTGPEAMINSVLELDLPGGGKLRLSPGGGAAATRPPGGGPESGGGGPGPAEAPQESAFMQRLADMGKDDPIWQQALEYNKRRQPGQMSPAGMFG